ncbi:uncharacterized protein LOC111132816 isoform X1 [Crassostrea virginica]|uniref:Uncharacterized protein LOC111132816 n=1 Tax=Crassostrea virginica TaxID=6565 RepID=A0A8B8E9M2_CRAVI|nr:uncharacterized protein LOC111132816 [Crassostrea virginica]
MAQCTCLSHQASTSSEENRAIIPTDDSFSISSIQPEDSIEFVSQVILVDDLPETPPRKRERYEKRQDEVERKKISRCVALSAILLLGVCIALMGVSFTLTSKIDEMVRNSNSVLRKHNLALTPHEPVTNESYFN